MATRRRKQSASSKPSRAAKAPPPRRRRTGTVVGAAVEQASVGQAVAAAGQANLSAARSVQAEGGNGDLENAARALDALMAGLSPDDASALRRSLAARERIAFQEGAQPSPDDELSDNWRSGGYPYRNRMLRKNYER